jgi:hypothetical protein
MLNFDDFLKESNGTGSFALKDFMLSRENDPESKKMLEELSDELENMDLPNGIEEIGSLNYNSLTPSLQTDMKVKDFNYWKTKNKHTRVPNEEAAEFLRKLDTDFFLDPDDEEAKNQLDTKKYIFFEVEPPVKLKRFASSWGMVPFIVAYMTGPEDIWTSMVITFIHDERVAHDNRGSIQGRKYNV